MFLEQLSQMLVAGISFTEAFSSFAVRGPKHVQHIARRALADIEEGRPIASVFHSNVDQATLHLFATAERVGNLPEALNNFVRRQRQRQTWLAELVRSLSYPLLLLLMCFVLAVFVRFHIQPELQKLEHAIHGGRSVESLFNQCIGDLPFVVMGMMLALPGMDVCVRRLRSQLGWSQLTLPFDSLLENMRTERLIHLINMQIEAGSSLVDALETLVHTEHSRWLMQTAETASQNILQGQPFSDSLQNVCPPIIIQFVRTGETTGDLTLALQQAQMFLEASIASTLKRIAAWLEPCAMGLMGLIVGSVMYNLFGPMYQTINALGAT